MKTQIPDGKGGWMEVDGKAMPGQKAKLDKQAQAAQEEAEAEAVGLVEHFHKAGLLYQSEHNLSTNQVAFAICLLALNAREYFPDGGPTAFDEINQQAVDYFVANLPKKKR